MVYMILSAVFLIEGLHLAFLPEEYGDRCQGILAIIASWMAGYIDEPYWQQFAAEYIPFVATR